MESPTKQPRSDKGGPGTTFYFTIRFALPQEPYPEVLEAAPEELHGVSTLIVDDNRMSLRYMADLLNRWDMLPVCAESGKQALTLLRTAAKSAQPIQLVLLDSQMPDMDGFSTAKEIRQDPTIADVSIMMLTSSGQRGDAERCRELGIGVYLMKPVRPNEVHQALRRLIGLENESDSNLPFTQHSLEEDRRLLRILVVEDNLVNRKLIQRLLEKHGHTISEAEDGLEALALMENNRYDIVFMDLQMPNMDGFTATREIRKRENTSTRRIPIVALTAYALDEDRRKCLEAGMDAYLPKPINSRDLYEIVDKVIQKR